MRRKALHLLILVLLPVAAGAATPPQYEIDLFPAFAEPLGGSEFIFVNDAFLNDLGQVAGTTEGTDRKGRRHTAVFFHSPEHGFDVFNPGGNNRVETRALNNRGEILIRERTKGRATRRLFLYKPGGSYKEVPHEFNKKQRRRLRVVDFNDRGQILASSGDEPFLYNKTRGWQPLRPLSADFASAPRTQLQAWSMSARNHIVLKRVTQHPVWRERTYLLFRGRRVIPFEERGWHVDLPGTPNESGQIAGTWADDRHQTRAYYFDRTGGIVDLHRNEFSWSASNGLLQDGTALVKAVHHDNTLHFYLFRKGQGLAEIFGEEEFSPWAEHLGCRFGTVYVEHLNERKEMAGTVTCKQGPNRKFFLTPEAGLFDLRDLIPTIDNGSRFKLTGIHDLNDRGQILISGTIAKRIRLAVLTPME